VNLALKKEPSDSEFALLLACLRAFLGGNHPGRSFFPPEAHVSWARFLWLADRHQVVPLVAAALESTAPETVPMAVRMRLEQRRRTVTAHNLSLSAELLELLSAFRRKAILAVPFKGPALGVALYGNLSHRQTSDLDLFVQEEGWDEATEILQSRGYQLEDRAKHLSRAEIRARFKDVLFTHPGTGVHLEVHWSVAEPEFDRKLSSMPIPDCSRTVHLLGEDVPIQAPEDLLLLLCAHGLRHRWDSLKWICDIAALLRRHPGLDWALALKKARPLARERTLLLGVFLARNLIVWHPPATIESALQADSMLPLLAEQIEGSHGTASPQADPHTANAVLEAAAFDAMRLRSREKASDRVLFLLQLLREKMRPSAEDRQWISLPLFASAFYWVLRPVRILHHYGAKCSMDYLSELIVAAQREEHGA
jgi:hypothetical protein